MTDVATLIWWVNWVTSSDCYKFLILLKNGGNFNCESDQNSFPDHTDCPKDVERCVVTKFLLKLRLLGCKFENTSFFFEQVKQLSVPKRLESTCQSEIEDLKKIIITENPKVTLYDFLFFTKFKFLKYIENANLIKISNMYSHNFKEIFLNYGDLLNHKYKHVKKLHNLRVDGNSSFDKLIGSAVDNCYKIEIFKYLNNDDLRNIIQSIHFAAGN